MGCKAGQAWTRVGRRGLGWTRFSEVVDVAKHSGTLS